MINKLTKEQEAKIPEYREQFRQIGLSTEPCNRPAAEAAITASYLYLGKKEPKYLWADSPQAGAELAAKAAAGNPKLSGKKLAEAAKQQLNYASWGNVEAFWVSTYAFIQGELPVTPSPLLPIVAEIVKNVGWYWTFENLVICTERPKSLHFNADKRLHRDLGPAIEYRDGFSVYALNGIRMPREYVMTPASELSVEQVMKEQNVDIRRELLRKIGLERFVKESGGKVLDEMVLEVNNKRCVYQLLDVTFGEVTAKVLKMDNPSINAIHVEGVEDHCNTVKEALAWRNGFDKYAAPQQLT